MLRRHKESCTNHLSMQDYAQRARRNSVQITWQARSMLKRPNGILYKSLGNERSMLRRPVNSVQITWYTVDRSQSNNWDCLMGLPKPITQGTTQWQVNWKVAVNNKPPTQGTTQWQVNWKVAVNNKPTTQGTTQSNNPTQLLWSKLWLLIWQKMAVRKR